METRNLNIRLPADLYRKLQALAESERRTLTMQVTMMLEMALEEVQLEADFNRSHK